MKILLDERDHRFWTSWMLWTTIGGLLLAIACMVWFGVQAQREDTQRRLDASALKSVMAIEQQIVKLREADAKSAMDRGQIKRELEDVKEDIEGVPPPFIRAGKAFKKGVDRVLEKSAKP